MSKAFLGLTGDMKGDYFPLRNSKSYVPKPSGMSADEEAALRTEGVLFEAPDSAKLLSAGVGRNWPDGRGLFVNEAKNVVVWFNQEEHARVMAMQSGADMREVFERFCVALTSCDDVMKSEGYTWMHNEHLGYIVADPANLGTGLRACVTLRLPKLSARKDFKEICSAMKLTARAGGTSGVEWEIFNSERLGVSEVDLVNTVIEGAAKLVRMEEALGAGSPVHEFIPGLGETPLLGLPLETPEIMPDLSEHTGTLAMVLKKSPAIYDLLQSKVTKKGLTLAMCIKAGVDKDHPVPFAGDEDSYEVFSALFDPVIDVLHGGYAPTAKHTTDLDASALGGPVDVSGKYVVSTKVEASRSIRGLRLFPVCKKTERREAERVLCKALLGLDGALKGDYYPLMASQSYIPKPAGMSAAEQSTLGGLLFGPPDAALLAAGMAAHGRTRAASSRTVRRASGCTSMRRSTPSSSRRRTGVT
jgi:creatine kinase